ncbi:MAG TPA: hypothetical protein VN258_03530 [Mobilitalea sp.]|nr:hypothetical protein [Mobilitalea sp.]
MGNLYLIKPTLDMEAEAMAYRQEYFDYGEGHINGSAGFARYDNYGEWLARVQSLEKDAYVSGNIHASTYFSVRTCDNKIIGTIQLRHGLSEELRKHGGHIGYGIRPAERRKAMQANNWL